MNASVRAAGLLLALVALFIGLVFLVQQVLPAEIGSSDFVGYWAGAYLILHGQDPYDADNILQVQQEYQPNREHAMFTWNPPWLGAILLPLGSLSFPRATAAWLVGNMLLLSTIGLGIWWLFDGAESQSRMWLAWIIVFLFPQTITTLDTGQITTLVLLGMVGFLVAYKRERWFLAGALLALTTVKPHLVFLWLPLVFLWTLDQRRWQVWIGFGLVLLALLAILTIFLPSWPQAYSAILRAPPTNWSTPTLGGVLERIWGLSWGRYLGLLLLPLIIPLWWKTRHGRLEVVTAGLVPVGLSLAVFGWSYDQIQLLIPLIAIAVILVRRELAPRDTWLTLVLAGVFAALLYLQRIRFTDEFYYFWVPWAVLLLGAWVVWRREHRLTAPV